MPDWLYGVIDLFYQSCNDMGGQLGTGVTLVGAVVAAIYGLRWLFK